MNYFIPDFLHILQEPWIQPYIHYPTVTSKISFHVFQYFRSLRLFPSFPILRRILQCSSIYVGTASEYFALFICGSLFKRCAIFSSRRGTAKQLNDKNQSLRGLESVISVYCCVKLTWASPWSDDRENERSDEKGGWAWLAILHGGRGKREQKGERRNVHSTPLPYMIKCSRFNKSQAVAQALCGSEKKLSSAFVPLCIVDTQIHASIMSGLRTTLKKISWAQALIMQCRSNKRAETCRDKLEETSLSSLSATSLWQ